MAGNSVGGRKAAKTNKLLHGEDFYSRIGRKGGKNGTTGGFYNNRELASKMGRIGGKISKRGPALYKRQTPEWSLADDIQAERGRSLNPFRRS